MVCEPGRFHAAMQPADGAHLVDDFHTALEPVVVIDGKHLW